MATLVPSTLGAVCARGRAAIAAIAALEGAPAAYDTLPQIPRDVAHLHYGVGILRSVPLGDRQKQRQGSALASVAEVGVRLLSRLRADNQVADYETALNLSDLVIATLIGGADGTASNQGPQHWTWEQTTARTVGDGTHLLIEQRYTVLRTASNSL